MSLLEDLRSAARRLRRQPVFAGAVVLTLGLAIGANTAIFTVVEGVLLRQLPFTQADRLVVVGSREADSDTQPFSIPDFLDIRQAATGFDGLAAWASWSANLTGVEQSSGLGGTSGTAGITFAESSATRIPAQWATAGFFELLGIRASLGRTPLPEEERAGAPRVALLSDGLWREQFGADRAVLGRSLTLNGEPFTVIGVLPPDFLFLTPGAQLVAPLVLETDARRARRGSDFLRVLGRLRPGTTAKSAAAELDTIVARLRTAYPVTNAGKLGVRLQPLFERVVGAYGRVLAVLQAAVVLVLLVACTNLASLQLARVASRRKELAMRAALGASRRDLLRQLLAEALLLALGGGALGLALAVLGVRLLPILAPTQLPRMGEVRIGLPVLAFNLALSLAAGLLCGLLPALQGSGRGLADELRTGGRGTEGRRSGRLRAAMVLTEVCLAVVLLVAGGLMLRSLRRLREVDPGYRPERLLSVQLSLPKGRYGTPAAIERYRQEVTSRLAALPGVERVAAASLNPLVVWRATIAYTIEGRAEPARDRAPLANYRAVGPGYASTLGMPLLLGRDLDERDRADGAPVALVSAALARRHFRKDAPASGRERPPMGALGARLVIDDTEGLRTVEIVGVVGDVKHTGLDADGTSDVYVPYAQTPPQVSVWLANIFCLAVRTKGDPLALAPAVRREIGAVDRDVATSGVRSMEEALTASLAARRFQTRLLEVFAAAALLLALAGVHAVTAIGVAERRRELGVRLSMGATRAQVLGLVLRRALAPVSGGIVLGVVGALALGRVLSGLLYGVTAHDPATLAAVSLALAAAAVAASLHPALRAARLDPAIVLRSE